MEKSKKANLHTPNDDSFGHCYAPVVNGHVINEKAKHYNLNEDYPVGSVIVPCSPNCSNK